jgi:RNA polymerase sigma-70 factor (ECF subfamily)
LGDSAVIDVFERYREDVYRWAYRVLGRHHDALDAAQDVFLRWLNQSRTSAPPRNARGWLRQATINRSIDLLRARRSDGAAERAEPMQAVLRPVEAGAEEAELREDVAGALAELSEAQRCVLVAKVYDGMTFAEIADELGVATPTAKTHYLRALRGVRDRLERRWLPGSTE